MRITFILPAVAMGGGTKVISIYAQELMKSGHDVFLVSRPPKQPTLAAKFKSFVKRTGWPPPILNHPSHLDGLDVNHQIIESWRPITDSDVPDADVVIATWWETAEWVYRLGPEKGAKVYFIQHHEVFPYLPVRSRDTYRLPLHKVVVAQWLKDVMATEYGDQIVDVVTNSVDHTQFFAPVRQKQPLPTVGFLYSSVPSKGMDVTLAATELLTRNIPHLRVICFGSERTQPHLELPPSAEFFLNPPQAKLRNLYAGCDVWVTASRTEGFNLPAMEAMACRTPVVSTRAGWPSEAIKSDWNGILVDVDDISGLAEAMEQVLKKSDNNWQSLSDNAFATVASSSWKNSADCFERALYHARERVVQSDKKRD